MIDLEAVLKGSTLAAARLINLIEDEDPRGAEALKLLYPHAGRAFLIGITGPAGAGKSTLIARLIASLRRRGKRVGVVAVDPSSPFTGGALLGDRIRMQGHETDPGVFIRSMAARGRTGGLSRATREAALVMDAMGCDTVVIETVGVGQGEVDISGSVHATAVVCVPGLGDEIQAMKAGLLEIADLFIVNKADLPGAEELAATLESLGRRRESAPGRRPPWVVQTCAARAEGVEELLDALYELHKTFAADGRLAERRARNEFAFLRELVMEKAARLLLRDTPELAALKEDLQRGAIDPYSAADRVFSEWQAGRSR